MRRVELEGFNVIYDSAVVIDCAISAFSYVGASSHLVDVQIGRFCSLGPWLRIVRGRHPLAHFVSTHPAFFCEQPIGGRSFVSRDHFPYLSARTVIGSDVWIGSNVTILGGLRIGDGAVLGTGAIVTEEVPDFAVVAGNPAVVRRYRFSEEERRFLSEFRWWDRDPEWLQQHAESMTSIERLRDAFDRGRS